LDQLERELVQDLTSDALVARYAEWRNADCALACFRRPADALRFLRSRPSPAEEDAVLRPLVALASDDRGAGRLVLHAILPGLKNIARRSLVSVDEREELWSSLLCSVWEQICTYSVARRPRRIAANLLLDTMRSTLAAMRRDRADCELVSTELYESTAVSAESGANVGALVGRAVAAGAISPAEAELVLSTRFDCIPLAHLATSMGEPYNRVKVRRQRAERRLLVWLGYPPVPRRPQKRPLSGARVVGAGS
jgi:DNA-directed RNA polymerase specialized sigma24 family protein